MALGSGTRLGPYEIVGLIGKGGMGEVYRAKDTRLGREVAIKVSAHRFSDRFEREARAISSLNHPNICTLYDVGENYLDMELVDGQPLSARLATDGALPLEEALAIARQIAAALEAAHDKGITHRDLKPGNVMLKEDGTIKVLDFGLAKIGPRTAAGDSEDPDLSPTLSMAATQAGVVLGTAAYMAPEQARGKPVDKRADIWAFGVVLYEMVTGKKLFAGEDLTDTLASVVKTEPDLGSIPLELHPLLKKCLEKDPRKRLRDISGADAYLELGRSKAAPQIPAASPTAPTRWRTWIAAAVGMVAIAAASGWAGNRFAPEPPSPQVIRTALQIDPVLSFDATLGISRDGSKVVYPTAEGLRIWKLDSFESTLLPGTVGARFPFFSFDGQQIGYFDGSLGATSAIKRIPLSGGPSTVVVEQVTTPVGTRWMQDGEILYANNGQGIYTVPANGGTPKLILKETAPAGYPQFLENRKQLLFSINGNSDRRQVVVQNLADGTRHVLTTGSVGTFLSSGKNGGHLIFWSPEPTSRLLALALDQDYNPVGNPFPMINGIAVGSIPKVGVSESGTIAYESDANSGGLGALEGIRTLTWVDEKGKETPLPAGPDNYRIARISPTGDRVAVQVGFQIWIWNVANQNFARLPDFGQPMEYPIWTPDGQRIIFRTTGSDRQSNSKFSPGLYSIAADGSGAFQKVLETTSAGLVYPDAFTPDRSTLLAILPSKSGPRPFGIPVNRDWVASGEPRLLRDSQLAIIDTVTDPSGRWLVYTTFAGQPATYFSPYPDAERQQIPLGGVFAQPVWSRSGKVLYVANGSEGLFTVQVDTSNGLKLGTPQQLLPNAYYWGAQGRAWDVAPDGRFFMMKSAGQAPAAGQDETPKIRAVVNWIEELRKQVPLP